jgi:hypothetical protein
MSILPDVFLVGKLDAIFTGYAPAPTPQAIEFGWVEVALCGYGPMIPRVSGESVLARVTERVPVQPATEPDAGQFQILLFSNGLISPPGTYYTVTIKDSNEDIVQVEAYQFLPGQWDLSQLVPFDPNLPPPPLPVPITNLLLIVPWESTPNFPGDQYTSWQITLTGDTWPSFTNLYDGNLYTIIVIQNTQGNHYFNWPGNTYNVTLVNPLPNSMTIQTFIALADNLYPIGAATYFP